MENIAMMVDRYYVVLGGCLFFRESENKRARVLNFEDFKRTYRKVGTTVDDAVLKSVYTSLAAKSCFNLQ